MSVLLASGLAGAAVAVLLATPRAGRVRLAGVTGGVAAVRVPAVPLCGGLVGVAALPVLLLGGPVLGCLALVTALASARVRSVRRRAASAGAERAAALHACGVLSGELAAGRSPAEALSAAAEVAHGPVREALRAGAAAAGLGGEVPVALAAQASVSAVPGTLRSLAACWTVCAQSGGGLAAAVARLEEGLRAEAAQRRRVEAELAGPRATAALLAVLPGGGLLLAAGIGADPLHVLLETPVGLVCLVVGLGLDGLGLLWTDRLVRRVRPP